MNTLDRKDLVVLVADLDMQLTIEALLRRDKALDIRLINYTMQRHPAKDSGCFSNCQDLLRSSINIYDYVLVLLDKHGCGQENSREDLESEVEERLSRNGWSNRSSVIVLDPELESWVWGDSLHVPEILGWKKETSIIEWLKTQNFAFNSYSKPYQPKEALERVLRETTKRRSSSIYKQLAEKVRFQSCLDPSFLKLKSTLQNWFPN